MSKEDDTHIDTLSSLGYDNWMRTIRGRLREIEWLDVALCEDPPYNPVVEMSSSLLLDWRRRSRKAAGMVLKYIGRDDIGHVREESKGNCYLLLEDLRKAKADRVSSNRFVAYQKVLTIKKGDDDTYGDVLKEVQLAIRRLQSSRPSPFTLKDMDADLEVIASMKALDPNDPVYINLSADPNVNMNTVRQAFHARDVTFQGSPERANAVRANSKSNSSIGRTKARPNTKEDSASVTLCHLHPTAMKPHSTHDCYMVRKLINEFKAKQKDQPKRSKSKNKNSANLGEEGEEPGPVFGNMTHEMDLSNFTSASTQSNYSPLHLSDSSSNSSRASVGSHAQEGCAGSASGSTAGPVGRGSLSAHSQSDEDFLQEVATCHKAGGQLQAELTNAGTCTDRELLLSLAASSSMMLSRMEAIEKQLSKLLARSPAVLELKASQVSVKSSSFNAGISPDKAKSPLLLHIEGIIALLRHRIIRFPKQEPAAKLDTLLASIAAFEKANERLANSFDGSTPRTF